MKQLQGYISEKESISIRSQCDLLGINRSMLYYQPVEETQENLSYMRLMDEHFLNHPTHGVLQMQDFLFLSGYVANHKRIRRLLRLMGIMAIYPKRNLSKLGYSKYIRHYLLKGLKIISLNQVWAIDITYIPMAKGFMYLTAIIDLYSRFIVGWGVSNSLAAENTLDVLKQAIGKYGQPGIINSDQGSQFTCQLWTEYVENAKIAISMDSKGRALDNIYIERFWRTVKQDYVYLQPATSGIELYRGLEGFIGYYNNQKPHQGIGRVVPASLYEQVA
jgi:putative transposase